MKKNKKTILSLVVLLCLSVFSPACAFLPAGTSAQAAQVKISKTKLTLDVGKTAQLKMTGTGNKKVTWSSSNKDAATVTSKGKVKAIAPGTAKITATVTSQKKIKALKNGKTKIIIKTNKKKYSCAVTVNAVKPTGTTIEKFTALKSYLIRYGTKLSTQETYYIAETETVQDNEYLYMIFYNCASESFSFGVTSKNTKEDNGTDLFLLTIYMSNINAGVFIINYEYEPNGVELNYKGSINDLSTITQNTELPFTSYSADPEAYDTEEIRTTLETLGNYDFHIGMKKWDSMLQSSVGFGMKALGFTAY